jgi:hypothetical protein
MVAEITVVPYVGELVLVVVGTGHPDTCARYGSPEVNLPS